jgi:hypothetical protein
MADFLSRYLCMDGFLIDVVTPFKQRTKYTSTAVTGSMGRRNYAFTSGSRGLGHWIAADRRIATGMRPIGEFDWVGGGRVSIVAGSQPVAQDNAWYPEPILFGIWQGSSRSIHALTRGFPFESIDSIQGRLLEAFASFEIVETPLGVYMRPRDSEVGFTEGQVMKDLPTIAWLEIEPLSDSVAAKLPRATGTPVRGGELFSQSDEGHSHDGDADEVPAAEPEALVLVGTSAVTTIAPTLGVGERKLLDIVSELDVQVSGREG